MKILISFLLISISAIAAATALNQKNIQGEYVLKAHDIYLMARISMANNFATLSSQDQNGGINCRGTYLLNEKLQSLEVIFPGCNQQQINYKLNLKGQTLESLLGNTEVLVSIKAGMEVIPNLPFSVQKLK